MNGVKSVNDNNIDKQYEEWSQQLTNLKQLFHKSEQSLAEVANEVKIMENDIQIKQDDIIKMVEEISTANEICRELNERLTKLLSEQRSLKFEIEVNEPKKYRSKECKAKMAAGHKTLHYYKRVTGIRWDYGAIEESLKGAITNYKDYLKNFNYPYDTVDLTEKLWEVIYKAVKNHIPNTNSNK